MLTKIHHALIDGMSGAEIMGLLLDLTPEGRELTTPDRWGDDDRPRASSGCSRAGLLGLPRYPLRALRSLPAAVPNIEETPFAALPGAGTRGPPRQGASAARNGAGGPREELRRAQDELQRPRLARTGGSRSAQLSLDDVKAVKNAHGVTVNDVVVTICAGAVRRWLVEHGELPAEPLVAQIPVSVRTDEQIGTYGNRIMLMSSPLFTDEPDPLRRLQRTHEALGGMKERHRALPATLLQDANHFIPPAVFSRAAQLTFRLATSRPGRPTWNLVISNVPARSSRCTARARGSWPTTPCPSSPTASG